MKTLKPYIIILSALLVACGTGKDLGEGESQESICPKGILVEDMTPYEDSAPVTFEEVSIDGNILNLKISYSGGCKDHSFKLIGSTNIMKSLPPKRGIKLYHENNDDNCRELITEELCFDISEFAYQGGEIVLMMEGMESEIRYTPEERED